MTTKPTHFTPCFKYEQDVDCLCQNLKPRCKNNQLKQTCMRLTH